jgi:hypothetical protein
MRSPTFFSSLQEPLPDAISGDYACSRGKTQKKMHSDQKPIATCRFVCRISFGLKLLYLLADNIEELKSLGQALPRKGRKYVGFRFAGTI